MQLWRAEFKSSYLEEIASKTGQSKPYIEFLKLLFGALSAGDSMGSS